MIFLSLSIPSLIYATLVNVTVDDSQTSNGITLIQYTPSSLWNDGPSCVGCTAHPNPEQTLDGTWHDSTHEPGAGEDGLTFATLQFDGESLTITFTIPLTGFYRSGSVCILYHCTHFSLTGRKCGPDLFHRRQCYGDLSFTPNQSNNLRLQRSRIFKHGALIRFTHSLRAERPGWRSEKPDPIGLHYLHVSQTSPFENISSPPLSHDDGTSPSPSSSSTSPSPTSTLAQPPSSPQSSPSSSIPGSTVFTPTLTTSPSSSPATSSSPTPATTSSQSLTFTFGSSVTVTSISTNAGGTVTVVDVLPAPTSDSSSRDPAIAGASSHSVVSSKTRTIIIASVVPGVVALVVAVVTLVIWCRRRRSRYDYSSPSEPDIADDPGSSGWTGDAWVTRGDNALSNHDHSSHGHSDTNGFTSSSASKAGTVGRARGFTASSAVTAMSTRSAVSDYSQSGTKEYHSSEPSSSGLSYATETASRTRHPYSARTPEPTEEMDNIDMFRLPTVNEMSTPAPSSSASHSYSHEKTQPMESIPGPSQPMQNAGRPRPPRPLPVPTRTVLQSPGHAGRFRRLFRTPSGSPDLPPSYEDISGERRESQRSLPRSIHDTKL